MKPSFSCRICTDCLYNKARRCTIAHKKIEDLERCPERYTVNLMSELADDYRKRIKGIPHGDVLSREW